MTDGGLGLSPVAPILALLPFCFLGFFQKEDCRRGGNQLPSWRTFALACKDGEYAIYCHSKTGQMIPEFVQEDIEEEEE
jgi:hypothetical protein